MNSLNYKPDNPKSAQARHDITTSRQRCSNCQMMLPAGARFCLNCGQPAAERTRTDEAHLIHLAATAPLPLVEKVRAATNLTSERRLVTALFVDIVGSRTLSAQVGPKSWSKIMDKTCDWFCSVIYRYEGAIARFVGDELLAFFGAPVAHEDDPVRAVRAALEILDTVAQRATAVRQEFAVDFSVRISLSTGPVTIGPVSSDLHFEYSALAGTLNLAAQLEATKRPMAVLVSAETYRLVAPFFNYIDLGEMPAQDQAEIVHIYQVTGPKTDSIRARSPAGLVSPMVGRDPELATLLQLSETVAAGLGRVVLIVGESGLGKTRLIAEWKTAVTQTTYKPPLQWAEGHCLSHGRMIVSTGDGRFGWKPRLIDGSVLRHTLSEAELVEKVLHWDEDVWDALWPTFLAQHKYNDRSPAKVALPNETVTEMPLVHYGHGVWGTPATPELWVWLGMLNPQPGDHLLFRVIDGEERWHAVTFEVRADRDEEVITERNKAIIALGQKMMQRPYRAMDRDITTAALATGLYRHDVPPDPFGELWPDITKVMDDDLGYAPPEPEPDPLLSALFERPAQVYDLESPPSLPREYDPQYGRRQARQSLKARKGSVKSWIFRVNHRAAPDAWADIELAEDQTLEDLHLEIQSTFHWADDHLYSFFIGDETGEKVSEVGSPWSDTLLHTHLVTIGELGLAPGRLLLYLFDYGDNHEFDVEVIDLNPLAPKGQYPKILSYPGINKPKQYPDFDDDVDW